MKEFILARMSEPSTWRGLVAIATSTGINIEPDMAEAIISIGFGIIGLIGAIAPDKGA